MLDALDLSASVVSRYSDGRIMTIDRHVFLPKVIGEAAMFRLSNIPRAGWAYVTDDYLELARGTDLHGADFDLVWTSNGG